MESVWCHDCRTRVEVAARAFDDDSSASSAPECPACSGVFLERADPANGRDEAGDDGGQRGAFPGVLLGTAFIPIVGERGVFGDIDLTQFDTRNFDSPASASAVEALREGTARDAGAAAREPSPRPLGADVTGIATRTDAERRTGRGRESWEPWEPWARARARRVTL